MGQRCVHYTERDNGTRVLYAPNQCLWYNENLLNGIGFCIRDWYDKGIILVSDIIDEEGNIYIYISV